MIQVNNKPLSIRPALAWRESLREKGILAVIHGCRLQGYAVSVIDSRIDEARAIISDLLATEVPA